MNFFLDAPAGDGGCCGVNILVKLISFKGEFQRIDYQFIPHQSNITATCLEIVISSSHTNQTLQLLV